MWCLTCLGTPDRTCLSIESYGHTLPDGESGDEIICWLRRVRYRKRRVFETGVNSPYRRGNSALRLRALLIDDADHVDRPWLPVNSRSYKVVHCPRAAAIIHVPGIALRVDREQHSPAAILPGSSADLRNVPLLPRRSPPFPQGIVQVAQRNFLRRQ